MTGKKSKGTATSSKAVDAYLNQASDGWDKFSDRVEEHWDELCDYLEEDNKPDFINWISKHILRRLTVEAPVVITFCFVCVFVHILQQTIWSGLNRFLAVHDTFDIRRPMQIPSLITHVIAHDGSLGHVKGNMVHLLLVGPSAEHVYGSKCMLLVILLVALASSAAHILLGSSHTHQLGASGVVFSVILLNSLVAASTGKIPVSFVLTASLWCIDELYKFFLSTDGVSHHAHLTGAIVGTAVAFYSVGAKANLQNKLNQKEKQKSILQNWWLQVQKKKEK